MYTKLDEEVERLLCCPWCKSEVVRHADCFVCNSCGLRFPSRTVQVGESSEEIVFDFRIQRPDYCTPESLRVWNDVQSGFEQRWKRTAKIDSLQHSLDSIDLVREIYTAYYHLEGKVLDVGGHQGWLRQYLGDDVSLYVDIDPYVDVFAGIEQQPMQLRAYPSVSKPCNFVAASAEYLPFKSGSFDWIHMKSVVDHFADPYLAFLEAYRCSRVGGKLLVGLAIMEKLRTQTTPPLATRVSKKLKQGGMLGLARSLRKKLSNKKPADNHLFRLTHGTLMDLFAKTGWDVVEERWQKPPCEHIIYACGQKREPS